MNIQVAVLCDAATDENGKLVLNQTLSGSENQVDVTSVASGVYFLNIYSTDNQNLETIKMEKLK